MIRDKWKTEDGRLHHIRSQDVEGVLRRNAMMRDVHKERSDLRFVGSIPSVIIEEWARESGLKIGSEEFDLYIERKLRDSDNAAFVIKGY